MLPITHIDYIRDLYFSKGKTLSEIGQITGRNYRTIKKYVMQEDFNESTHHVRRPKRSEVLRPIVHQWLQEDKARPPKQRHTATRLRRNLFVPEPCFDELAQYNHDLLHQCSERHREKHYLHHQPIEKLFSEELSLMMPVNPMVFDCCRYHTARVNKQGLVHFERGIYSVSPRFVGELVVLTIHAERIEIYSKDLAHQITSHRRLFGEGEQSIHHVDFIDLVKVRPRALKYSGIYQLLPPNWRDYLDSLEKPMLQGALEVLKKMLIHEDLSYAQAVLEEALRYDNTTPESIYLTYRRLKENRDLYRGIIDVPLVQTAYEVDLSDYSGFMEVTP